MNIDDKLTQIERDNIRQVHLACGLGNCVPPMEVGTLTNSDVPKLVRALRRAVYTIIMLDKDSTSDWSKHLEGIAQILDK